MNVAAYIRVSTDEQADRGNSLMEQRERLKAYCVSMGWNKPKLYIDDGYSAKDLRRPAIKKLLDDVSKGEVQVVLTTKLDRFCRNMLDLLSTVDFLSKHDCSYVSSTERFDTSTAHGRMTLNLLGTFAEFERERTSERVKDNMLSIAKNSDRAISGPCYGYDISDKKYAINEEEAKIVKYMFDLALNGDGHRMIAKKLNDRGLTTKRKKQWDQVNVKRLITNKKLTGTLEYNKRETKGTKVGFRDESEWIVKENNHPAIIPVELFNKVQEILHARSKASKHADSESYLLSGIVKCNHCGKNMKGCTSRNKNKYGEYTYYRYLCSSYSLGYGCKYHAVHRDDLESLIIEEVKRLEAASVNELDIKIAPRLSALEEIQDLKSQLSRMDNRIQKQLEAFENDLITADDLRNAGNRIKESREEINRRIEELESKTSEAYSVQKKATELLPDILGEDRLITKKALRLLIEEVLVTDGKFIDITWK